MTMMTIMTTFVTVLRRFEYLAEKVMFSDHYNVKAFGFFQLKSLGRAKNSVVCLNSKFSPPVELCWQNKNISKLGILITKVGNIIVL
jgi:hypothetical protein